MPSSKPHSVFSCTKVSPPNSLLVVSATPAEGLSHLQLSSSHAFNISITLQNDKCYITAHPDVEIIITVNI